MPSSPFLTGNFAPVRDERGPEPCSISGRVPQALRGTLFRNGANPQLPPAEPYHWFTGDGMVHAITLGDGVASYCNRWVRTERFRAEAQAGRPLFAGFGQPLTPEAGRLNTGVANTHVLHHARRLLALEEAHLPVRLDPQGLDTLGEEDFGGAVTGRFTAHPKHDPATGQLVFFSYSAGGPLSPSMSWGTVEADGRVSSYERFEAPYCSMVHDFGVTAAHVVVPVMPLTGSMERAMSGRPPFAWEGARETVFGVIRRSDGVKSIRWVAGPPCFAFHVMNAFDDGGDVAMDVVEYDAAPFFPNADGSSPGPVGSRLARWRITARGQVERKTLDLRGGEFPRIDERWAGLPYRYGFRVLPAPGEAEADSIVRHDLERGESQLHTLRPGERASEAVFVPRSPEAPQGDGWLLTVVWRPQSETSALQVLDTAELAEGAVAEIGLPRRVPFGFHGSWVAAEAMAKR